MDAPDWEHFPHAADMGVRGFGDSPAQAFEGAALAMTALVTELAAVRPLEALRIECRAGEPALLLYDFLNALAGEMSASGRIFGRFAVQIDDGHLRAEAWGELLDRARHQPAVEVKGATFTELAVRRGGDGRWLAQCVLDV